MEYDGCMCLKHSKYKCFHKVPHFQLILYFGVSRDALDLIWAACWALGEAFWWSEEILQQPLLPQGCSCCHCRFPQVAQIQMIYPGGGKILIPGAGTSLTTSLLQDTKLQACKIARLEKVPRLQTCKIARLERIARLLVASICLTTWWP